MSKKIKKLRFHKQNSKQKNMEKMRNNNKNIPISKTIP